MDWMFHTIVYQIGWEFQSYGDLFMFEADNNLLELGIIQKKGHPSSKQTEHPFNMNPNLRSVAIWQRLADSVKIEYDKWYVPDSLLQWEIKHKFLYAKSKTKLVH